MYAFSYRKAASVADVSAEGGPGVVGYISVDIARYGVADIGMLVIPGWRGLGGGLGLDHRMSSVGLSLNLGFRLCPVRCAAVDVRLLGRDLRERIPHL